MTTRKRTRVVVVATCLVAALAAGAGVWAVVDGATEPEAAPTRTHHDTAPVTKGDLVDTRTFSGTLGYGAPVGVPGAAPGTITWLPRPGQVVHRDEPLYAVDERPVRAMHGGVPLWRDLRSGERGADVRQLNEDLAALGYDVAQDDRFGPRTRKAVERWQRDRGLRVTGVLTAADIAFVDGDVRVASVPGRLGQATGADVLMVTSTERVVTATVPQRDAERLTVGTAVTLVVNGAGDPIAGTVDDATPTPDDGNGGGGATVDVTIGFDVGDRELPAAASVRIDAQGEAEHDVLSVPVTALVVRGADGFAVDVVRRDGSTKRTPVRVGFVAQGRAAVTGDLAEGDRVVVP